MFKRIFIPLDGSSLAEAVLPAAQWFGECFGATLVLFHVIEQSPPAEVHGERHLMAADDARQYLDGVVQRLARPDLSIEVDVHTGKESDVAGSIVQHTEELNADLVMLCTHGHGGLRDVLVGSIAQQVIGRGQAPVFLVRPDEAGATAFQCRRVLLPLDGTPVHEPALPVAVDISHACGALLHLLTIVPTSGTLSPARAATRTFLPSTMNAVLDLAEQDAVAYLKKMMQPLLAEGVKVSAEVQRGDPSTLILAEITDAQFDLVVMATHARQLWAEFWEGGVTPKILSQSATPVLLVRVSGEEAPR